MCGICGATEDPAGAAVAAMNDAMFHRGPDDGGSHTDPQSGTTIGARRLSIIDVAGGHQPLCNEDGSVWAALNGEIYNHPELRRMLVERGHTLTSGTDTEVLVHLYEELGDGLAQALEGMFSFVIWDGRRQRLLIGRDRFGEKPLFYHEENGRLTFASELTTLLAARRVAFEMDAEAVHSFFVFGYVAGERSMCSGVRQLRPGHLLSWDVAARRAEIRTFWEPPGYARASAGTPVHELASETHRLLEEAVRSRMISDVPLGVFLSGGVDSTLVAAIASRLSSTPVKTFSVGYDVGAVSETSAAARTAARLGATHCELTLTSEMVGERLPGLLASLDQPLADQSLVALNAIAERAREDVTVVVGGEGADELFGGYPRYRWMQRARTVQSLVPAPVARASAVGLGRLPLSPRTSRLAHVFEREDTIHRHIDWVTERRREERPGLYGPRLSWATRATVTLDEARAELPSVSDDALSAAPAAHLMLLDQRHWLPGNVLAKADRASMLCSLEVRTPFLSRELAEFAASVPAEEHVRAPGKTLLRRVLEEVVPADVRPGRKTAFRVPAAEWLRGPLAGLMARQVRSGSLYSEGWFDRERVATFVREHNAGVDKTHVLWPLMALGIWADRMYGADT